MSRLSRLFWLVFYYGFARRLPAGWAAQTGPEPWQSLTNRARCLAARRLFRRFEGPTQVERGAWFGDGRRIEIGARSMIGEDCRVNNVCIGKDVLMGPEVVILHRQHGSVSLDVPIREQPMLEFPPVQIEDGAWIGTRAIIMPGVRVGHDSIVAAGAVVTTDVPAFAVVAGVPARTIRDRREAQARPASSNPPPQPNNIS